LDTLALKTTYTIESTLQEGLKLEIGQVRGAIRAKLLMTDWGDHYFGVDLEQGLEVRLFINGTIQVKGDNVKSCEEKTDQIIRVLREELGTISYNPPRTTNVRTEDEITSNVSQVVPNEILEVIAANFSSKYYVQDVSFGFRRMDQPGEAMISIERTSYKGGLEVPLILSVEAPNEPTARNILEAIRRKLGSAA
jgi:hypothetical protein